MTPEQKEEINALLAAADGDTWAYDSELMDKAPGIVRDLWAALEEAEKQIRYWEKIQSQTLRWYRSSEKELTESQQTIARAINIFETADAETDFDNVLHGMYEALKGTGAALAEGAES